LLQAQEETVRLDEEVSILKEKLGNTEAQLRNALAEIKRQLKENEGLKSRMFCMNLFRFTLGFQNCRQ